MKNRSLQAEPFTIHIGLQGDRVTHWPKSLAAFNHLLIQRHRGTHRRVRRDSSKFLLTIMYARKLKATVRTKDSLFRFHILHYEAGNIFVYLAIV
jgi:hypothetical protein